MYQKKPQKLEQNFYNEELLDNDEEDDQRTKSHLVGSVREQDDKL